jgi:hypothetical protein
MIHCRVCQKDCEEKAMNMLRTAKIPQSPCLGMLNLRFARDTHIQIEEASLLEALITVDDKSVFVHQACKYPPLVMNPTMSAITPTFCVLFDNWLITGDADQLPDFSSNERSCMFQDS